MSQALFGPWGANKLSVSLHVPTVLLIVEGGGWWIHVVICRRFWAVSAGGVCMHTSLQGGATGCGQEPGILMGCPANSPLRTCLA